MRRTDPEGPATAPDGSAAGRGSSATGSGGRGPAGRADPGPGPAGHGPVRYGPHFPDDGLPVLPELSAVLAAAAGRARGTGGGAPLSWRPRAATGTGAA